MSNGLGRKLAIDGPGTGRGNALRHDAAAVCDECGYDLRGTAPGGPCPECGRVPRRGDTRVPAGAVWTVSVTLGLGLLLLLTLDGVSSVLVQPFDDSVGGTLPSLNLPGPKLWAVPLLQRPIGNSPELPGVIGTRTAMLSLLAVWLVTARPPGRDGDDEADAAAASEGPSGETLRLVTRWGTLVAFGANFGVLVSQHGFWPMQLPPYRVLLVCTAELPATLLLYLYLDRLAAGLPGRARRRAFEQLLWVVPAVIAGGGALLVLTWLTPQIRAFTAPRVNLPVSAVYGVVAVCAGVAASSAVAWLAGGFALRAFPGAWRAAVGTRRWLAALRAADFTSPAARHRARACAVAAGLLLLPVVMILGIEKVGWYYARQGFAGNLPFYNFPGPKLWAAAGVPELGARYWWGPIGSRTVLTVANLLAFWLVTAGPVGTSRESGAVRVLRLAVRWLPVAAVGAALGCASTGQDADGANPFGTFLRSEFFAAVTVACELPVTILLYVHLAVLAGRFRRRRLQAGLLALGGVIVLLVGAGMTGLAVSRLREPLLPRRMPEVFAVGAAYGAIAFLVATCAVVAIVSLAWHVYAQRDAMAATDAPAK